MNFFAELAVWITHPGEKEFLHQVEQKDYVDLIRVSRVLE